MTSNSETSIGRLAHTDAELRNQNQQNNIHNKCNNVDKKITKKRSQRMKNYNDPGSREQIQNLRTKSVKCHLYCLLMVTGSITFA